MAKKPKKAERPMAMPKGMMKAIRCMSSGVGMVNPRQMRGGKK